MTGGQAGGCGGVADIEQMSAGALSCAHARLPSGPLQSPLVIMGW